MAGSGPAQGRMGEESLSDTIRRRTREAEAAAYEGIKQAIRRGEELQLKTPGEVLAYGAKRLHAEEARAKQVVSNTIRTTKRHASDALNRLGENQKTSRLVVGAAQVAGIGAGVGRGAAHAGAGLVDGVKFVSRLADPFDALTSPQGQSAVEQLGRGAQEVGRNTVNYVQKSVADPRSVVKDLQEVGQQWRRDLDPSATPAAPTFEGELRRNFDVGQNQGEVLFDAASLLVGGPAAKAVKGLERVSNIGNVERYVAQGFSPKGAARLAEPYPFSAMGHHFIPRRAGLPENYSDSVFNVLKPRGVSRGDFYELHYKVDPKYYGGPVVRGEGWSGKRLGLDEYGLAGRLWHGSPPPLKARVGGLGASAGAAMNAPTDEEAGW